MEVYTSEAIDEYKTGVRQSNEKSSLASYYAWLKMIVEWMEMCDGEQKI